MHEIALHHNHNIDDFRAPFTEESLKAPSIQLKSLTPYHQGLLAQCLQSVHDMFRTFTSFDLVTIKAIPIFYFVRIAYAVVVLIKLRCAIVESKAEMPFREEDLQVDYHLDSLLQAFQRIASEDAFRPAKMFMIVVSKLRDGFKASKGSSQGTPRADTAPIVIEAGVPDRRKAPAFSDRIIKKIQSSRTTSLASTPTPQDHMQHQQQMPQQPQYSNAQTPLHFLSEVATHDANQNMTPYQANQWYEEGVPQQQQQGMNMNGLPYGNGPNTDPAFEQAMDMTMSIGDGDLSSLFMEGGGYGYGQGMVPEGAIGAGQYGTPSGWQ